MEASKNLNSKPVTTSTTVEAALKEDQTITGKSFQSNFRKSSQIASPDENKNFESFINEETKERRTTRSYDLAIKQKARTLFDNGKSNTEISRMLSVPESTIRGWLRASNKIVKRKINDVKEASKEASTSKQLRVEERGIDVIASEGAIPNNTPALHNGENQKALKGKKCTATSKRPQLEEEEATASTSSVGVISSSHSALNDKNQITIKGKYTMTDLKTIANENPYLEWLLNCEDSVRIAQLKAAISQLDEELNVK